MTRIEGTADACARARERIHAWLDGESGARAAAAPHLGSCASCRILCDELQAVRRALRALPSEPLPDAALDAVWRRTSRSVAPAAVRHPAWDWRAFAAAAALALVLLGGLRVGVVPAAPELVAHEAGASEAELRAAASEARLVLNLTANAIRRTERVAVGRVLAGEVGRALDRVPIEFPAEPPRSGARGRVRGNDV